jgi:hypothetical protein
MVPLLRRCWRVRYQLLLVLLGAACVWRGLAFARKADTMRAKECANEPPLRFYDRQNGLCYHGTNGSIYFVPPFHSPLTSDRYGWIGAAFMIPSFAFCACGLERLQDEWMMARAEEEEEE